MFETSLNKTLLKYLASCFGLIQFADILINRSILPEILINVLLIISFAGFFIIVINYYLSQSKDGVLKTKINIKSSALIFVIFLVSISNIFFIGSAAKIKKMNKKLIPRISNLIDEGNYFDAFLAIEDTSLLADHFPELLEKLSWQKNIDSSPSGSKVYMSKNSLTESTKEVYLGETPLSNIRLPRGAVKLKFVKDGYDERVVLTKFSWTIPFKKPNLNKSNSSSVIKIDSLKKALQIAGIVETNQKFIPSYEIDINEVTNSEYLKFLQSIYYNDQSFWEGLIKKYQLRGFSFKDVEKFKDATGQNGPSTWSVGRFENGKDNFPVLGISWFEALGYCEFKDKTLPNIYQWDNAAGMASSNEIIPMSNILKKEPIDVNDPTAVGFYGLKNMAGNAREWIFNKSGPNSRFILGGGYSDEIYLFNWVQSADLFDRTKTNGCRCSKPLNGDFKSGYEEIQRPTKDISKLLPVDDKTYQIFKSQYEYDKFDLNASIKESKINQTGQRVERVEFDSFNNQKMQALLYLPIDKKGPFKTILFYPGSGTINTRSSQRAMDYLHKNRSFLVESGYALIMPIFTSTFERGDGLLSSIPNESISYRDHVITWGRELQLTVDYLQTREDIDFNNLAYMGWSWGGRLGSIMVAIENRFKTGLLIVGGMRVQNKKPEVDPLNFLPRINIPILMLNGRYDHFFPVETSQIPMYNFLGTETKHKKHIIYETGHSIPFNELAKESLDWLEKYLN